MLLLRLLEDDVFFQSRAIFFELDFTIHLLAVFGRPVHRLRALIIAQFDKIIL